MIADLDPRTRAIYLVLLLAPLLTGFVRKVKARLVRRQGASILQPYRDLLRRYYGPAFTIDADDGMEWAYIPHFYYKYYVYSYATGLASGIAIADRVREQGEPAAQAYLNMLRGGCAKPPLELLRGAGVDLTTPQPIEAAMTTFARTLDEVEKLLAK